MSAGHAFADTNWKEAFSAGITKTLKAAIGGGFKIQIPEIAEALSELKEIPGFPTVNELSGIVPTHAITVTIPAWLSALEVFCVVPGASKAAAVQQALHGPVDASCPASVLRHHEQCTLYLDADSAPRL
jgi:glucosamine-6-phosphate deaminase